MLNYEFVVQPVAIFSLLYLQDTAVRLKAQTQLALPVLVSCLIALLAMLIKVGPEKARNKRKQEGGKQE